MADDEATNQSETQKLSQKVRQALRLLDLHEWLVVLILLVLAGGTWSFLTLSEEVAEGDPELTRPDERLLLALREPDNPSEPLGSAQVESTIRDVTALGSPVVLSFLVLTLGIFLWLFGYRRAAVFMLVATVGGALFSQVLKEIFVRQRPDLVSMTAYTGSYAFPSGHAMTAAVTYLTLGILLASILERAALKVYVIGVALVLAGAVGISRVYLGVHWPSDVIAGWAAGTIWALLMWLAARWFRTRRAR